MMKQTEIGLIPDDWEVRTLGDLFEMKAGGDVDKQHFSSYKSDKYTYKIFSNGLENEGIYGYTDLPKYKGDSITITGRGTVGVSMYRKDDFDAVIRLLVLNSKKRNITDNFFISEVINETVKFPNESTGVPQLTVPQIKDVLIPVPPLAEQQRIAKALSDVDTLISTTEKLIQKKKNIKQGTMQNLLIGKKRLPGFGPQTKSPSYKQTELGLIPEDWEVKSLGEMLKIGHGKDYKNLKSGNVPVYGTGGYMTSVNDFLYEGETVCIGRKGTIDKPQYHSGRIWTVDTLFYTYDFKSLNPKYLFYKFCLIDWLSMNEASGVPSLTAKNIEDIQIVIPTEEEQNAIANVLSSMDKEIETLNTKLEKYRNLKTAMMQQLLTGKIRLIK
jgi:type I restriction enzyme S subunit